MPVKPKRVIIDTNLWISFLIGKRLHFLRNLIIENQIKLLYSKQLKEELVLVTKREKLSKYFKNDQVQELIQLIDIISENITINKVEKICRDPKDDFLLALAIKGKADYLITGDDDLLLIKKIGKTKIVNITDFAKKFDN